MVPPAARSFGEWVRSERLALGLTQQQLGERVSCSSHAIRKIEAGERQPSERLAQRLASHLQLGSADRGRFLAASRGHPGHPALVPGTVSPARGSHGASALAWPQILPLVGREPELARLRGWLAQLRTRSGRVVLVTGEPGGGKSRMLTETVELAAQLELPVVKTKCFEIETGVPYCALVKLVQAAADQLGDVRLGGLQDISRGELSAIAPALAPRLQPLPELSNAFPEARQVRLFAAIDELFDALAAPRGLVVAVDDCQWLDGMSAQALHSIARHAGVSALMLVIASRVESPRTEPDFARSLSALNELEHAEPMTLSRLSRGDVGALLEALLGQAADRATVERLYAESAGNPFFLREMLHVVLDPEPSTSPSTLMAGARASRVLPATLHTAVQRRLGGLSPATRDMLNAASVLGRRFDFDLLRGASQLAEDAALDALDELIRHGWLVEDDDGVHYDFAHDKLRESVYQELSRARRRSLHRRVAEHMTHAAGKTSAQAAVVAEHAEAAGSWALAMEQRTMAGDHAQKLLGLRTAETHYTAALYHCAAHRLASTHAVRIDLLERRGAVRALLSDVDSGAADLREAIAESERNGMAAARQRLLTILGMTFQRADRYAEGIAALEDSLSSARAAQDHAAVALANYWLGDIAWTLERNDEAGRYFEEVMNACRAHGLGKSMLAKAYHGQAEVASLDARPLVAFENFDISLRLSCELGDRFQQCENLSMMGWMHMGLHGSGEYAQALAVFDRCMEVAKQADFAWCVLPCGLGRAVILSSLGRFEQAQACFEAVESVVHKIGMPRWEAVAEICLSWCRLEMEMPESALEHVRLARLRIESAGVSFFSQLLPSIETMALVRLGRVDEAPDLADDIARWKRTRLGYAVMGGVLARIEWLHAQGKTAAVLATAAELQALGVERGIPEMVVQAKYWQAVAAAAQGDVTAALQSARNLLAAMPLQSRFSLRLALSRLVVRLSGGRTEAEAAVLREMEVSMAARRDGGCGTPARQGHPPDPGDRESQGAC
ncbi:AAA family ATPase [Piscinibacter sp. XHJ-5]|uniref:ATP-binding protein n=1 Tax=Piscinibacter sp. XHJ-5 TaxID=3037797 RepID=UPI002452F631|nr:AAA family ATPase [Piscinibacter sp. XHJ-5]